MIKTSHGQIKLSILIPSVPNRVDRMLRLYDRLKKQIGRRIDIEVLVFLDNKKRSIGHKRDALVQMAKGRYLAFLDDDDNIHSSYIKTLIEAIKNGRNEDIITFKARADIDGQIGLIDMSIKNENEQFKPNATTKRKPFHVCCWKSSLAKETVFKDMMYGEDWHWCKDVLKRVATEKKINKVLYYYTYRSDVTEAK